MFIHSFIHSFVIIRSFNPRWKIQLRVRKESGVGQAPEIIAVPSDCKVALLLLYQDAKRSLREDEGSAAVEAASDDWTVPKTMLPSRRSFESAGGPMRLWSSEEILETQCKRLIGIAERNGYGTTTLLLFSLCIR